MYAIGDLVMYGIHGVCRVTALEERTVDRRKVSYLVLEPREQNASRFFVPMGNENAMSKLRPVLRADELEALLRSPLVRTQHWISDENQRKQYYRELITGTDRAALLQMVRTLHIHKQQQVAAGRKFHLCDENFLRDAQRLLNAEFSLVLGIEPSEVEVYILQKLQ